MGRGGLLYWLVEAALDQEIKGLYQGFISRLCHSKKRLVSVNKEKERRMKINLAMLLNRLNKKALHNMSSILLCKIASKKA